MPYGVTLVIGPWNYPFQLIMTPLAGILVFRGFMHAALATFLPTFIKLDTGNLWLAGIALTLYQAAGGAGVLAAGSISDWSKVERIQPLFAEHGFHHLNLHVVDTHAEARAQAHRLLGRGARLLISAGGSGTFNSVLEGCCDAGIPLGEIRLWFLRKGSADLLGKVLRMPDEIEAAVAVFAESIRAGLVTACDVLSARDGAGRAPRRHFVGYGGAEIFGRIPHFTENRFMKWYKGVLSQIFGDLGPFTTGMTLALVEKLPSPLSHLLRETDNSMQARLRLDRYVAE